MKTLLIAAATLGLAVSGALAECGHDASAAKQSTQTTASLDMSTTASTAAGEVKVDKAGETKQD